MQDSYLLAALVVAVLALLMALTAVTKASGLDRKLDLLLKGLNLDLTEHLKLSDRVKELAREPGHKIEAIKAYREETGAGFVQAKDAVELYIATLKT